MAQLDLFLYQSEKAHREFWAKARYQDLMTYAHQQFRPHFNYAVVGWPWSFRELEEYNYDYTAWPFDPYDDLEPIISVIQGENTVLIPGNFKFSNMV